MATPKPISSADYKIERFGILNAGGEFWTPDTFTSEDDAIEHVRDFWKLDQRSADRFLKTCQIIPVIVTVEPTAATDGRA